MKSLSLAIQVAILSLLALGSFVVSYTALRAYAETIHANPAWLWPVLLDACAVGYSYSACRSALKKRRNALAQSLVIACLALSVAFQVAHAFPDEAPLLQHVLALIAHAVAPLSLVGLLEVLIREAIDTHVEYVKIEKKRDRMHNARNSRKSKIQNEEQLVHAIEQTGSRAGAAKRLGVHISTVNRWFRKQAA